MYTYIYLCVCVHACVHARVNSQKLKNSTCTVKAADVRRFFLILSKYMYIHIHIYTYV